MNELSFLLKRPDSKTRTAVILLYTCSDGRLKYYTRQSVIPNQWPDKVNKGIKSKLTDLRREVEKAEVDSRLSDTPLTKQSLSKRLDKLLNISIKGHKRNMFSEAAEVLEKMRQGLILTADKKRYSPGTVRVYELTISVLQKFDPNLSIAATTMQTYDRFITWCHTQDYSTNYIGVHLKNWKRIGALIGGSTVFNLKEFKKINEDTPDIYLDDQELKKLSVISLPGRMDLVRDWFLLDCYTGLRVSDLVQLEAKNFGDSFITIANDKTDEKVVPPAHPVVKKIIRKYKGFPPPVTDVEINRCIKVIAESAGINSSVLYTVTKGGKRRDHYLKKYEMVSCHTARRSFVTNLRKSGVPDNIIMRLTGIKSYNTLKRYDKLSPDEAAKIAAKMKYFK